MAIFNECCCCKLRTGVIIIGVLGLIFPCLGLASLLYLIIWGLIKVDDVLPVSQEIPVLGQVVNALISFGIGWLVLVAVIIAFFIVINALLIHGARLEKTGYLIPWMTVTMIGLILTVIQLAVMGVSLGLSNNLYIIDLVFSLIFVLINFLLWLCVFSFRQQVLHEGNVEIVHYK